MENNFVELAGAASGAVGGAAKGAKIGLIFGPKGVAIGAIAGGVIGGVAGGITGRQIDNARRNYIMNEGGAEIYDSINETQQTDFVYERGKNTIHHLDPNDSIIAARPNDDVATWLKQIGVSTALSNVPQQSVGSSNISHSGGISINLSGTIQLQDPNGNIHNWDNLTNNPQFISQITDKISLEITKNLNRSSAGDGRLMYGNYSRGMFG